MTKRISMLAILPLALALAVPSAQAAPVTYVTKDCVHVAVEPHYILFACADGNYYANHLQWALWDLKRARGHGVFHQNDCKPDCASGHFHKRRGTIHLRYRRWCPKIHKYVFKHAHVHYNRPLLGRSGESFAMFCPI